MASIDCIAVIDYTDSVVIISGALDMAVLTVRNLDENLKTQLRIKAAAEGCSMEEQVRRPRSRPASRACRKADERPP